MRSFLVAIHLFRTSYSVLLAILSRTVRVCILGDRSGDGAATNGRVEGRGPRRDDPRRGLSSHQDGENGESKLDRDNRASMLSVRRKLECGDSNFMLGCS